MVSGSWVDGRCCGWTSATEAEGREAETRAGLRRPKRKKAAAAAAATEADLKREGREAAGDLEGGNEEEARRVRRGVLRRERRV